MLVFFIGAVSLLVAFAVTNNIHSLQDIAEEENIISGHIVQLTQNVLKLSSPVEKEKVLFTSKIDVHNKQSESEDIGPVNPIEAIEPVAKEPYVEESSLQGGIIDAGHHHKVHQGHNSYIEPFGVADTNQTEDESCLQINNLGNDRVVDSHGRICRHDEIDTKTACCVSVSVTLETPLFSNYSLNKQLYQYASKAEYRDQEQASIPRHTCNNCVSTYGCCMDYDVCVACCLHPSHQTEISSTNLETPLKHFVLSELWGRVTQVSKSHEEQGSISINKHRFNYCQYKCRSSSGSVQHENSYRSSYKYCFLQYKSPKLADSVNSDRGGEDDVIIEDMQLNKVIYRNIPHTT